MLALLDSQHPLGSAGRLGTLSLSTVVVVVLAFFREIGLSAHCSQPASNLVPLSLGVQGIPVLLMLGHLVRLTLACHTSYRKFFGI